jgi:DNA repair protein RecN (Recombination protein N)
VLVELQVSNLGVISHLSVRPGGAMTAVTGETGAGKTLIVGAIALLTGGRADASMVRAGATEAVVDGRFIIDGDEVVLSRVIPATGRSRAYRNGRPVPAAELAEIGSHLVEIHGQHVHQQLLSSSAQRRALDSFAGINTAPMDDAAAAVRRLRADIESLGGDERTRARNLDLLGFQLNELDEAGLDDPEEDDHLQLVESRLGQVEELRLACGGALADLTGDGAARDRVASAQAALANVPHDPGLVAVTQRLAALVIEIDELIADLRAQTADLVDDPSRLADVQQRRRVLTGLRRKYGATLAEVITEREHLRVQVEELAGLDGRIERLTEELAAAERQWTTQATKVGVARRAAAPALGVAVGDHLAALGMPAARIEISVTAGSTGPDAGDDVVFMLAANPGSPPQPLARVASGGELSRTMLALRLVLSGGPPVAVFDEVDAGIGGAAAASVAGALARVATRQQVLVVTHLAQVAARASTHVVVSKQLGPDTTHTDVTVLDDPDSRVAEIARMLSGTPDSAAARRHAAELLSVEGADPSVAAS